MITKKTSETDNPVEGAPSKNRNGLRNILIVVAVVLSLAILLELVLLGKTFIPTAKHTMYSDPEEKQTPDSGWSAGISCEYYDLKIPDEWVDRYVVETSRETEEYGGIFHKLSVYEKSLYEQGNKDKGLLFQLVLSRPEASEYFKTNHTAWHAIFGKIKTDSICYIYVLHPRGEMLTGEGYPDQYLRMCQDIPEILRTISSDRYEISLRQNEKITDIKSVPDAEILNLADYLHDGLWWIHTLLYMDCRLDVGDVVAVSEVIDGAMDDTCFPAAYGIKTKDDLRAYLSNYYTGSCLDAFFPNEGSENYGSGDWHEVRGNLYFGYNYYMGWYGVDTQLYKIEYISDTELILHVNQGNPAGEVDADYDLHLYFALEDGKLKLSREVRDEP